MFKARKTVSILLSLILVLIVFSGCAKKDDANAVKATTAASTDVVAPTVAATDDMSPLKLTFFDKNTGDAFDNAVALEITKRTGITIEIQQPTGNPSEKLNLMLASNDLPDMILMDRGSDVVAKYIAAGAIIPLNDLIEQFGPDVKAMYGDTLQKTRYTDGKNYYLSNWYGVENEPVFGMNMRKDVLKELAPDKAEGGVPFTTDEFSALLKSYKDKYPTVDGKTTIPLTMSGENMGATLGSFKGMWGLKTYFEDNGTLKYEVKSPQYKEMLLYMNKLYREGLMDAEWAVNKNQTWEQKISNGIVFASTGAYWDLGNANKALKAIGGDDKQLYIYKVVAPGVDPTKTTFGGRSSLGWDAIAITKANKHPERTMKLINFLASEEGQYLLNWGIEGIDWDMKDGKHEPKPETLQGFKDDWSAMVKKTGIRKWTWFMKNGPGSDGTPYDMAARFTRPDIDKMALKNLSDSVWDSAEFDNLGPIGGTQETLIAQKTQDIMTQGVTKMILAKTEADATSTYDKMLAEMKAAGDEQVEKIINENYQARMELWK